MNKNKFVLMASLVYFMGQGQAVPAFAGEICLIKGQRYEVCGDKLYPQINADYTDIEGVVHKKWITDYSTYKPAQFNSNIQPEQPKAPKLNKQQPSSGEVKPFTVQNFGKKHCISLSADTLFDFDKASLNAKSEKVLQQLGPELKKYGQARVAIDGHTDNIGSDDYNQDLSEKRAQTVKQWLLERSYIDGAATTRGFGSRSPVANNVYGDGTDYPQGRARNRRVEITLEDTVEETALGATLN